MRKWSVLLLLFALACTSAAPVASRPVADNSVNVALESRPDSAEVYVAGKFIGTTPMVARLAPGDHAIELRHPKSEAWRRELTVLPNSPTRVMAYLTVK